MRNFTFRYVAILLLAFLYTGKVWAQTPIPNCEPDVPTFIIDFTNAYEGVYITPELKRHGHCCDATGSRECLNMVVTIDSNIAGVTFDINTGAEPSGSFFYQIDCGDSILAGKVGCITTPGVHYITTCKPGGNANSYILKAVAKPTFLDAFIARGCYDTLPVYGIKDSAAIYTSIYPGTLGQYNNYLSCTSGCAKVRFTPDDLAPDTIKYRVCGYALASNCVGNQYYCDTITVIVGPRWSSKSDLYVCAPATTANAGAAGAGASWFAVPGNPSPATINASTGAITNLVLTGTYKFVLISSNSKCTDTILVVKGSKPNAGTDQTFCQPQSTTALGAAPAGFTWSAWSGNPSVAVINALSGAVTGMTNAGTYQFILSNISGCADTIAVIVKAQPAKPVAGANSPRCTGQTLNLTATTVAGATYQWTGPNGFSSTLQNPSRSNVTLADGGYYSVIAISNGCPSYADSVLVVVNATPVAPAINSNSPVCSGQTLNLSTNTVAGATYVWSGPNSFSSSLQTPSISNVTTAASGIYYLNVIVSGCSSAQTSASVVVNQTPPAPVASSNSPVCSGQSLSLIASNVPGATYSWSGPNGFSSNVQNPGISNVTTAASGTYYVTATVNSCPSTSGSTVVLVNQTPAAPVLSSNTPLCYGDTLKLFSTPVAGASYSWSGPNTFSSTAQNPVLPNATPAASGLYSLTVTVNGCVNTTPATTTVSVTSCPPVAGNDSYTTTEDQTLTVSGAGNILGNDYDPANPPQALTVVTTPACNVQHGSLTLLANGNFTYVPAANYNGPDSFCYRVCDTEVPQKCDTGIVYIIVTPVNDAPVVNDLSVTTPEDVAIPVCLNIADIELTQNHSVTVCNGPKNGVITNPVVNNTSSPHTVCFTYTPSLNFNGSDSVCLTVCDNGTPQLCDNAIVRITVTPVNDAPIASNDYYSMGQDTPTTKNVTLNDIDVDGPSVIITVTCPVTYGSLNMNSNGVFTYTPPVNFGLLDSFCYQYCDGGTPNLCSSAVVYLDYTGANQPPVAVDDYYTTAEDAPLNGNVLLNDYDPNAGSTLSVTTAPVQNVQHGILTLNASGTFTYTPSANYNGPDTFQYRVCDNGLPIKCDTGYAFITVTPVNDAPVVNDTTVTTPEDVAINVCLPIADLEISDLHATVITLSPVHGSVSGLSVNNVSNPHRVCFTYTPALNYFGKDSLILQVCDNGVPAGCDFAKVVINITAVNDAPVANDDFFSGNEDNNISGNVLTNDTDVDGPAVQVPVSNPVTCAPLHGSVSVGTNGLFTYIPAANYFGQDTFCYRICDNGTPNLCDTARVYLTINTVNDKPVVPDTTITTTEDNSVSLCIPITDNDAADNHSVSVCGSPANGTLSAVSVNNGVTPHRLCLTYKPGNNYSGTDQVCLIVCDNGSPSLCDTSFVTINVTPVNDPPYADTVYVVTYVNQTVPVNTSSASGDVEGHPLTFSYGAPSVPGTTVTSTGNGAITVAPQLNFTGVVYVPFTVCDQSPYPVTSLCDGGLVVVTVLPINDTVFNHAPVANNDYVTTPKNEAAVVNVLANDYDADGDVLQTVISSSAKNGTASLSTSGTLTYQPNSGFTGFDTVHYTLCDPFGVTQPRPLCDAAFVVIYVSGDSTSQVNDAPVAVDDYDYICADATSTIRLLLNDSDPNGDAITSVTLIEFPVNGTITAAGTGIYVYDPVNTFSGTETFRYVICDNGVPSRCDTGRVVIQVNAVPVVASSVASLSVCDGDSVHITFTSNVPGAVISWTGSDGSSGLNSVHTVLSNTSIVTQTVTYTASAVSPFGCGSNTVTVPVTVKPRPQIAANSLTGAVCSGEQVTILLSSNQFGSTFNWTGSNGSSGTGNVIIDNPVNNGNTNVAVTYTAQTTFNGCVSATVQQSVSVKPRPVITLTPSAVAVCSGQQVIVSITSNVSGTTYNWSTTSGLFGSTPVIYDFPVNPSNYTPVSVNYIVNPSANGCSGNTAITSVIVRPQPLANAGLDKIFVNCSGNTATLGGSPTAAGGTSPYFYNWSPATGLSSNSVSNPVVSGISTDIVYYLTVTDVFGCAAQDAVLVDVQTSSLSAEAGSGGYVCTGQPDSVQLGGFPTAVGGYPLYTYSWFPSAGLNLTNIANPDAKPLVTTKYFVLITDDLGCTALDSTTVNVKLVPAVNAGNDTAVCQGQPVILGGNPVASGGSGSGYTYSWSPVAGLNNAILAKPVATPASTTTYTVTVTDPNGCTISDEMVLTIRTLPVVNASADKVLSLCANDTVIIGNVPVVTSGGTAPFTYSWSPAIGLSSSSVANPSVSGITNNTTYQVSVSDTYGCTGSDAVVVTVVPKTLQAEAGNAGVICAASGASVTLGGTPSASGGTGPYVYQWSPSAGLSSSSTPNPVATVTATTVYRLTVTDAKGCTATDSVTVRVNASPVANAGTDTTVCSGFGKILGGSPTASGGSGMYQYSWTPTTGLSANNVANPSCFPLITTTYIVVVTDSAGCQASDAVTINVRSNPLADAGSDKSISVCSADSVVIGGSPAASGGAPGYTYSWGPATGLSAANVANPVVKGISSTTVYALTVTDNNGCTAADAIVVNLTPNTLTAEAGNNSSRCQYPSATLTLGGLPTAVGGSAPYTYNWSPQAGLSAANVANPSALVYTTTKYYLTVTDSKGCIARDSVTLTIFNIPTVNAGLDQSVCQGGQLQLGGNPTASGSASPYTYSWSPSIGMNSTTLANPSVIPAVTSGYTVTVTDANGCTSSDGVNVLVRQNPVADAGTDKSLVACSADSVMIGGTPSAYGSTGPYQYNWSPAAGLSSATASNPYVKNIGSNVTYNLQVTDQYGCTATDQVLVSVSSSSLTAEAGNNATVCEGYTTPITIGGLPTAVGGTPPYTYNWFPATGLNLSSVPNPLASPTVTTVYTVVITDANGCVASDTVSINVNPAPRVSAGANDTICLGSCVTLGGTPTALGSGPFTYSWQPTLFLSAANVANPQACPQGNITYTVQVTDALGCTASSSVTITVNSNPLADAGIDKTVARCPNACVLMGGSPAASGGTAPYTYAWSPSTSLSNPLFSNPTVCNLKTNTVYTLTVTDANGCTSTDQVIVQAINSTLTADAGVDKTICAGQTSCVTIGGTPSVVGGTPPYAVYWSPISYFCNSNFIPNPDVNPVDTTTYVLLVQDAQGCVAVDTMRVFANPAVTASVKPDTAVCAGSSATLGGVPATGSGGTAPYTYSWSPTLGMNNPSSGNPTVTPFTTTSYCVTVTDAVGCSASTCQAVNVNTNIQVNAGIDKDISACANATITIGGSPTATGGSGLYSYSWTPANGLSSTTAANPQVQNLSVTTLYTLLVTDLVSGCSSSDQVLVTLVPSSLDAEAGSDQFICYDATNGIQIGGIPTAVGGQLPYTYEWSPATGLSNPNTANPLAQPVVTTTYYLTVTDALGCVSTDTVLVTVTQPDTVAILGLNNTYCVSAGNVALTGLPAGGVFSGAGVSGNLFQPSAVGPGNWCITYTYTNPVSGCSSDTTICVQVNATPEVFVNGYAPEYCSTDSAVTLIGTPEGGIFSGNGINGNQFIPGNASVGVNVITYTYNDSLSGCSNTVQFSITVNSAPSVAITANYSEACPGADVNLSATYSVDVFNVVWTDAAGNILSSGLNGLTVQPGYSNSCYMATAVSNISGCIAKDTLCITLLDCSIDAQDEPCATDTTVMNTPITLAVLNNDLLPQPSGSDTVITIKGAVSNGTTVVNADHTITIAPAENFEGEVKFVYEVCVTINGHVVCDTANVCITVIDTTIRCYFPNTITPNNDGQNETFEISCNDAYPEADLKVFDRWGAEVWRSIGHYNNDWNGVNQQGVALPDGTYFYMYSYNNGTGKIRSAFVDIYR